MATRLVQVNLKAHDDVALGGFWAAALGWEMTHEAPGVSNLEPPGYTYPDPVAVVLDLVVSTEPKVGKNRVHLDLGARSPEHQAELVARLEGLGATRADVGQGPEVPWVVLADPEGNEFCVLDSGYDEAGPIAGVVVDCADPRAMAGFWSRATDWTVRKVDDETAFLRSAGDVGPTLGFVRSGEPKRGWNRAHLDVRPYPGDDLAAEADRLQGLGATAVDVDVSWRVLADPEGNEFCLLAPG